MNIISGSSRAKPGRLRIVVRSWRSLRRSAGKDLQRDDAAKPAAGVLDALAEADLVLVAPSNPVVSIAPILAVSELRAALVGGSAPVAVFSAKRPAS